jgi:hypothetical protein
MALNHLVQFVVDRLNFEDGLDAAEYFCGDDESGWNGIVVQI